MKKSDLIIYRVVTILFSAFLLGGAEMYFFKHDMLAEMFTSLGVPVEVIYPMGAIKILGVIGLWVDKLKHLAYLGFSIDLIAAIIAHGIAEQPVIGPAIPLVLLIISFIYYRKEKCKTINLAF